MDEQWKTISTSPESTFSEFSSHDSITTTGSAPTIASATSAFLPLRTSMTMADIANTSEFQGFLDDFNCQQSSNMSRWQSEAEDLDQQTSSNTTYLINDFLTNRNIASSSMTDVFNSPISRLPTSTSIMSFHSNVNQKSIGNQRTSWSTITNSMEQLFIQNGNNMNRYSNSAFSPISARSTNRQSFTAIDNLLSLDCGNNKPMVHSHQQQQSQTQPHMVQSGGRSNSMPVWRGYLPIKYESMAVDQYQFTPHFSQKVFLGGIPSELTEAELLLILRKFGKCNIKWPKNDSLNNNIPSFCHVVFRESRSVCELLRHCTQQQQQRSITEYFLHIHMSPTVTTSNLPPRTNRLKPIQVVPWNMKDNVYVMNQENISPAESKHKDWSRTIFVSPLHGKMSAFSLGTIMSNVFGPVSMAQVNTDKYGYPTGTGTVLFCDSHSYMRAVAAGAIDIKCDCFHKLLDIDPFLRENEPCAFCPSNADLFCRNFHCLRSYCRQCWVNQHGPKPLADHQPATRRQQPLSQI